MLHNFKTDFFSFMVIKINKSKHSAKVEEKLIRMFMLNTNHNDYAITA